MMQRSGRTGTASSKLRVLQAKVKQHSSKDTANGAGAAEDERGVTWTLFYLEAKKERVRHTTGNKKRKRGVQRQEVLPPACPDGGAVET